MGHILIEFWRAITFEPIIGYITQVDETNRMVYRNY